MSNVLGDDKRHQVVALGRLGWSLRRIEQATGVRRETSSGYLKAAGIVVPGRGPSQRSDIKSGHFRGGVHRPGCRKTGHYNNRGVHRLRRRHHADARAQCQCVRAFRPVRPGSLIVQGYAREAGTLGMVLSDGADRWMLTCLHVVARGADQVVATDQVFQPNASQGAIADLRDAKIDKALDCAALKLAVPSTNEVLGLGVPGPVIAPVVGMKVVKSGWKTGITEGKIVDVSGSQVTIGQLPGFPADYLLATSGDSGAVWCEVTGLAPVALHQSESATGAHLAYASRLSSVLTSLGLVPAI